MNAIVPFTFETTPVRALSRDGEAWFIAADVCTALGIGNPSMAVSRLDEDERASVEVDTPGISSTEISFSQRRQMIAVNEAGLYTLALRSRDAMTPGAPAHRFRKWVTGEVLPALRQRGHYGAPAVDPMKALADPAALRSMLLGYSERVLELEAQSAEQAGHIAALEPQAAALERIAQAETGSMSITAAAKALQVGPRVLHEWMRTNRWTYRQPDGLLGYQAKIDAGLLEHKVGTADHATGTRHAYRQVLVTPKGLTKLAELLGRRRAA